MLVHPIIASSASRVRDRGRLGDDPVFRLTDPEAPRSLAGPASTAALTSLHTLLAIQEVEVTPFERRRRTLRRSEGILDELERLRVDLLMDQVEPAVLSRVALLLSDQADLPDDPGLLAVVREIEVRAAVELAKLERPEP